MITIDVTAEDIEKGEPCAPRSCPVALALRRTFPHRTAIFVTPISIKYGAGSFYTPTGAERRWIGAFDDGKPVKPFTFELDA